MAICTLCEKQAKRSHSTKPHELLKQIDDKRVFGRGARQRGFEEQDHECMQCHAKFTHSTDKNAFGWTLWEG